MENAGRNWFVEADALDDEKDLAPLKLEVELFASVVKENSEKGISNDQHAKKIRDLKARLGSLADKVSDSRKQKKRPFVDASNRIDALYAPLTDLLDDARSTVTSMLLAWAKFTGVTRIDSFTGGTRSASIRSSWKARLTDFDAACKHYENRREVIDILERIASADARSGTRQIPGFDVYSTQTIA